LTANPRFALSARHRLALRGVLPSYCSDIAAVVLRARFGRGYSPERSNAAEAVFLAWVARADNAIIKSSVDTNPPRYTPAIPQS
jgi:hypothetical protein